MKAFLTLTAALFFTTIAMATNTKNHDVKVESIKMGVVLDHGRFDSAIEKAVEQTNETSIARLYKRKNARVTKELSFSTKRNSAKMA